MEHLILCFCLSLSSYASAYSVLCLNFQMFAYLFLWLVSSIWIGLCVCVCVCLFSASPKTEVLLRIHRNVMSLRKSRTLCLFANRKHFCPCFQVNDVEIISFDHSLAGSDVPFPLDCDKTWRGNIPYAHTHTHNYLERRCCRHHYIPLNWIVDKFKELQHLIASWRVNCFHTFPHWRKKEAYTPKFIHQMCLMSLFLWLWREHRAWDTVKRHEPTDRQTRVEQGKGKRTIGTTLCAICV